MIKNSYFKAPSPFNIIAQKEEADQLCSQTEK